MQSWKYQSTSNNHLAIAKESITAVVMNSISYVGCTTSVSKPNCRLCLRELNILAPQDYKSLILVVFNKFVPRVSPNVDTSPSPVESKPSISSNQQAPTAYGVSTITPSSHTCSAQASSSITATSVLNPSTQPKQSTFSPNNTCT
jgi:hypothetical protein